MAPGISSPQPTSYAEANRLLQGELERRERKWQQNRLAQANYRRNQKQRIKALEAAASRLSPEDQNMLAIVSPPQSTTSKFTPPEDNLPMKAVAWVTEDHSPWGEVLHPPPENTTTPNITAIEVTQADTTLYSADDGRTALHRAVSIGSEPLVRLLLERSANVAKQDGSGCTALHLAAEAGSEALSKLLLERSADPSQADYLGRNALFSAVRGRSVSVVRLLLESGSVDVNSTDMLGNVPLHIAVEQESEDIASLLLEYGANVDA